MAYPQQSPLHPDQQAFNSGYPQPPFNPNALTGYPHPGYPSQAQGMPQPTSGYPPAVFPQQPAVVSQPVSGYSGVAGAPVPAGLQYLAQLDQLLVHQEVELLEAFTGFEANNRYTVKNSLGQPVFFAVEQNDCCTRNCCGASRPFEMRLLDHGQREVLRLSRPLRCDSCWFPCCLQELEVEAGVSRIGSVRQRWSLFRPSFSVHDADGRRVLNIEGPLCTCSMCGDVDFDVLSVAEGRSVGKISKQWTGLAKELFTDADNFGVSFPMNLDTSVKATLLAAVFLIDFMFFEKSGNKSNDSPGMF